MPDAFGVHKVVLTVDGDARCALVVPRVEAALCARLDDARAERLRAADGRTRAASI